MLRHRRCQVCLCLGEARFEVLGVQPDQEVLLVYVLVVVDEHPGNVVGHLGADRDQVCRNEGVVGRLIGQGVAKVVDTPDKGCRQGDLSKYRQRPAKPRSARRRRLGRSGRGARWAPRMISGLADLRLNGWALVCHDRACVAAAGSTA